MELIWKWQAVAAIVFGYNAFVDPSPIRIIAAILCAVSAVLSYRLAKRQAKS